MMFSTYHGAVVHHILAEEFVITEITGPFSPGFLLLILLEFLLLISVQLLLLTQRTPLENHCSGECDFFFLVFYYMIKGMHFIFFERLKDVFAIQVPNLTLG